MEQPTTTAPVLSERGEQAKALLAAIETATGAEALALAVLEGLITPPETVRYDDQ